MSIWKMTFCFYLYSSSAIDIIVKRWIITVNYCLIQLQCACFDRVAKIETLKRITADASQKVELGFAFNTLGNDIQAQVMAQCDNSLTGQPKENNKKSKGTQ